MTIFGTCKFLTCKVNLAPFFLFASDVLKDRQDDPALACFSDFAVLCGHASEV